MSMLLARQVSEAGVLAITAVGVLSFSLCLAALKGRLRRG